MALNFDRRRTGAEQDNQRRRNETCLFAGFERAKQSGTANGCHRSPSSAMVTALATAMVMRPAPRLQHRLETAGYAAARFSQASFATLKHMPADSGLIPDQLGTNTHRGCGGFAKANPRSAGLARFYRLELEPASPPKVHSFAICATHAHLCVR
jgi:hypothetical protein